MRTITRIVAINTIVYAAQRDTVDVVTYKRLLRSIPALGLSAEEGEHLLSRLEYHYEGKPRKYLTDRMKP